MTRPSRIPLTLALCAATAMAMPAVAGAIHPRPKGATPVRVPLVPAYTACATPNRQHGPPLAFPSCNPPAQTSSFLTVGTPDANGAAANSVGSFTVMVIPPTCCPPQDVAVTTSITDVRCKAGTTACGNANTTGGARLRRGAAGQLDDPDDRSLQRHRPGRRTGRGHRGRHTVPGPADLLEYRGHVDRRELHGHRRPGGPCYPQGSGNPRAIAEITQIQVFDGGADGQNSTSPNTLFAVQGLFIP